MVTTDPAEEHRRIAGRFTELIRGVPEGGWDAPAPVEGWVARDVVRHLVEWFPPFVEAGAGVHPAAGPSVDDDPVAAWAIHRDSVQAVLDDPATAGRTLSNPHIGEVLTPEGFRLPEGLPRPPPDGNPPVHETLGCDQRVVAASANAANDGKVHRGLTDDDGGGVAPAPG
jgi:Mycothiol maleylpyruvate isomerase N-terminal domain